MMKNYKLLDKGEIQTLETPESAPVHPSEDPDLESASSDSDAEDEADLHAASDAELARHFHLPAPNAFLPTNLTLCGAAPPAAPPPYCGLVARR